MDLFVLFMSCVSHAFASVHCCPVITCWERTNHLALLGDVYCIFVTLPCGVLDQVWCLIYCCLIFAIFQTSLFCIKQIRHFKPIDYACKFIFDKHCVIQFLQTLNLTSN